MKARIYIHVRMISTIKKNEVGWGMTKCYFRQGARGIFLEQRDMREMRK